jgi:mRNA-degrading endonuclease toxin of MazEF toxin-antitoxin module
VVSNNIQNEFDEQIMVAPLSSEIEQVEPFEVFIDKTSENGLEKPSKILLHRIQSIDKIVRLKGFIGIANSEIMEKVNKALKLALDLD